MPFWKRSKKVAASQPSYDGIEEMMSRIRWELVQYGIPYDDPKTRSLSEPQLFDLLRQQQEKFEKKENRWLTTSLSTKQRKSLFGSSSFFSIQKPCDYAQYITNPKIDTGLRRILLGHALEIFSSPSDTHLLLLEVLTAQNDDLVSHNERKPLLQHFVQNHSKAIKMFEEEWGSVPPSNGQELLEEFQQQKY